MFSCFLALNPYKLPELYSRVRSWDSDGIGITLIKSPKLYFNFSKTPYFYPLYPSCVITIYYYYKKLKVSVFNNDIWGGKIWCFGC